MKADRGQTALGRPAALAAFVISSVCSIAQLLAMLGLIADPYGRILIFVPSLLLAPCVVLALVAAYERAADGERSFRLAALTLALLYASCAGIVYINQLAVVIPRELSGTAAGYKLLACCAFQEPMTAIDLLGYTYLSIAMLLAAPTYSGWLRWMLAFNGVLAVPEAGQLQWPVMMWLGTPWLVVFPAAMWLLAKQFKSP